MLLKWKSKVVAVAAAGTAEPLFDTKKLVYSLVIKAVKDNTGDVYVGDADVDSASGFALDASELVAADAFVSRGLNGEIRADLIYVDAGTNDDAVHVLWAERCTQE